MCRPSWKICYETLPKPDLKCVSSDLHCGDMSEWTKVIRLKHNWPAVECVLDAALHIPAAWLGHLHYEVGFVGDVAWPWRHYWAHVPNGPSWSEALTFFTHALRATSRGAERKRCSRRAERYPHTHTYSIWFHFFCFLSPYTFSALFNTSGNGNVNRKLCITQRFRTTLYDKSPLPPPS